MNAVGRETAAGSPWLLFDLVGSGVAVTTPDGALDFCNAALLQLLAQDASYSVDVRLSLSVRSPLLIGESAAAHLYLIVQEAINNAVKHGRARSITVTVRTNRARLSLSIADDGVGIAENPARGAGMGLRLMEYRCAVIGGVMKIKRLPDGGTRIRCVCQQGPARRDSGRIAMHGAPAEDGD
jgi:nitrate/nitrite-specific signal transduction histidine kinase